MNYDLAAVHSVTANTFASLLPPGPASLYTANIVAAYRGINSFIGHLLHIKLNSIFIGSRALKRGECMERLLLRMCYE